MSITSQLEELIGSGNCPVDGDGNFIPPPTDDAVSRLCDSLRPGLKCPADLSDGVWELTDNNDSCLIDNYVNEAIKIGAAVVNVFRLLGVTFHHRSQLSRSVGSLNEIITLISVQKVFVGSR